MLEILVNGNRHTVAASPGTPLLYVLRNELNLTGAKFGCGLGQCGACTVHLDGNAVRSCVTPVESAAGRAITTVEGLGPEYARERGMPAENPLHPLQQAFLDEQAAQCGYCTSGMIMAGAALLRSRPTATERDMRTLMSGNLCRCGSHLRILRALKRLTKTD
jgi:aerobic-type carbon monoxide dehydrogenase small subunit (CoxS/CutS family)